jgi:hypothetical protein
MPARLIQVNSISSISSANSLQLVEVSSLATPNEGLKYAALSHCWGDPTLLLQTTSQNLLGHMQEIIFETLPQTFQDAVTVTKKLGIPYLWIDCLCIVQDDPQDWQVEAAKMGSLYQNAYLTIAATKTRGSTEGLFISYAPALHVNLSTPNNTLSESTQLRVRPWDWFEMYPGDSPLLERAWVFQEMMLSRRSVHFAEGQLYWSCASCTASEDGLWDSPTGISDIFSSQKNMMQSLMHDHGQLKEAWKQIVTVYSKGALTFTKDKFPALAGIIKKVQEVTGDTPIAGLWKSSLLETLGWRVWMCHVKERIPMVPSWSWASINEGVQLVLPSELDPSLELIDSCVEWSGEPHTSSIVKGILTLKAPLILGTLLDIGNDHQIDFDVGPDGYGHFSPDTSATLADQKVACFFLESKRFRFLALQQTGEHPSEYRRVGHGTWGFNKWMSFAQTSELWDEDKRQIFTIV